MLKREGQLRRKFRLRQEKRLVHRGGGMRHRLRIWTQEIDLRLAVGARALCIHPKGAHKDAHLVGRAAAIRHLDGEQVGAAEVTLHRVGTRCARPGARKLDGAMRRRVEDLPQVARGRGGIFHIKRESDLVLTQQVQVNGRALGDLQTGGAAIRRLGAARLDVGDAHVHGAQNKGNDDKNIDDDTDVGSDCGFHGYCSLLNNK